MILKFFPFREPKKTNVLERKIEIWTILRWEEFFYNTPIQIQFILLPKVTKLWPQLPHLLESARIVWPKYQDIQKSNNWLYWWPVLLLWLYFRTQVLLRDTDSTIGEPRGPGEFPTSVNYSGLGFKNWVLTS